MSENKREMVKITIEGNGFTKVIECHGFAMVTLEDKEEKYDVGVTVMGNMCIADLMCLKETAMTELPAAIDENISQISRKSKNPLAGLLAILGGR